VCTAAIVAGSIPSTRTSSPSTFACSLRTLEATVTPGAAAAASPAARENASQPFFEVTT
jgi:hypothetical protein